MTTEAAFRADLVRTGLAQVGHDYRDSSVPTNWPPAQFDCSVFTHWLNAKHGLNIDEGRLEQLAWPPPEPRPWRKYQGYTLDQQRAARDLDALVRFDELKPGDRLYYDKPGAHHVVLYIGDGKVVHAAGTAYGVIVSPVVVPGAVGHGGKTLTMCVSATRFAKAAGMTFTRNPQGVHRIRVGGRTDLHVREVIRQARMSVDWFLRRNGTWRDPANPTVPREVKIPAGSHVWVRDDIDVIVAGRDRNR